MCCRVAATLQVLTVHAIVIIHDVYINPQFSSSTVFFCKAHQPHGCVWVSLDRTSTSGQSLDAEVQPCYPIKVSVRTIISLLCKHQQSCNSLTGASTCARSHTRMKPHFPTGTSVYKACTDGQGSSCFVFSVLTWVSTTSKTNVTCCIFPLNNT